MSRMKSAFCSHCFCSMLPNGDYFCCKCGRTAKESAVISFLDNYPQWNDEDKTVFPEVRKLNVEEMNSRLLSDEDLSLVVGYTTPDSQAIDDYERSVAIAQDARTSQWWMEKMDKLIVKPECYKKEEECCLAWGRCGPCEYLRWQDMKEIEIRRLNENKSCL